MGEVLLVLGPELQKEDTESKVHVPSPGAPGRSRVAAQASDDDGSQSCSEGEWIMSDHHHSVAETALLCQ